MHDQPTAAQAEAIADEIALRLGDLLLANADGIAVRVRSGLAIPVEVAAERELLSALGHLDRLERLIADGEAGPDVLVRLVRLVRRQLGRVENAISTATAEPDR